MIHPDLAAELIDRAALDQRVRSELAAAGALHGGYHPTMRDVHRANGDRLAEILDQLGRWPGRRQVGGDGAEAAWLIVIHDVANPTLMRRSLRLLGDALADEDAEPRHWAHLVDRIRYFEGGHQLYGTQLGWRDDGVHGIWPPIEDAAHVNERRLEVGLEPLRSPDHPNRPAATFRSTVRTPAEITQWRKQEYEFAASVGWRPAPLD